jgi:hypothetical protein
VARANTLRDEPTSAGVTELECDRCGEVFPLTADHAEIGRRNFREKPRPAKREILCAECTAT